MVVRKKAYREVSVKFKKEAFPHRGKVPNGRKGEYNIASTRGSAISQSMTDAEENFINNICIPPSARWAPSPDGGRPPS
jgi:hypothetical protein